MQVKHTILSLLILFLLTGSSQDKEKKHSTSHVNTSKPYSYWWWMGNAVDSSNIAYNLESMHDAGIGGVHIVPIYGVKGQEDHFIDYLSPRWVNMVKYTTKKAAELGMEVDMTLGTGWCFGGKWVDNKDGIMSASIEVIENCPSNVMKDLSPKSTYPVDSVICVMVRYGNGKRIDLTSTLSGQSVFLPDTNSPATLYILRMQGPKTMVKRAAPGAEGPMLNPLSVLPFESYSRPFRNAFEGNAGDYISSIYHDSYEYYGSSWSSDFLDRFYSMRGYRLQDFLPELMEKGGTEISRRVIADYRQTVGELHGEYLKAIKLWAEQNHTKFRNQAHGSPSNWLDTYAIADIPETEAFGSSPFMIPGFTREEEFISPTNVPNSDVFKFASSAAHVTGKPLVSSETHTWLREHFRAALSHCKPELDKLFVSGINHVYYAGIAYSPKEEDWPGWLFYASTNFDPSNSQFCHFPAQNQYVENCQKILQSTKPDHEIAVYFPFQDILHTYQVQKDISMTINVHNQEEWLAGSEFKKTLSELRSNGFGYDYISDLQLINSITSGKGLKTEGNEYRTLVIPACEYLPVQTLNQLNTLAKTGTNLVFIDKLPETYSGLSEYPQSGFLFNKIKQELRDSKVRNLKIITIDQLARCLKDWGNKQEKLAAFGLDYIRKTDKNKYVYFISNLNSGKDINYYVPIESKSKEYAFYNPMTGERGKARYVNNGNEISVFLQLKQGQSIFLFAGNNNEELPDWKYTGSEKGRFSITGNWKLDFLEGGPVLPGSTTVNTLSSWTTLPDTMAAYFSGLARYSIDFKLDEPDKNGIYFIAFDQVKESVKIRLNGKEVSTLFAFPYEANITGFLKKGDNHLELEVANLQANRIRYLEKQKVNWKKFYNINFVNIAYKDFDASQWKPVESGLTGNVSIVNFSNDKKEQKISLNQITQLAPGWKGEIITESTESYLGWDVEIGDADNDGKNEILTTGSPSSALLMAKRENGIWNSKILTDNLAQTFPGMGLSVKVVDLNGDGVNEILLGTGQEGKNNPHFYYTARLENSGLSTLNLSHPADLSKSGYTHTLTSFDADLDGIREVYSSYCGAGEIIRYKFSKDLKKITATKIHQVSGSGERALIADVDNDGKMELTVSNAFRKNAAKIEIYEFDEKGEIVLPARLIIDGFDDKKCFYASFEIGDVNNDGQNELVVGWKVIQNIQKGTIIGYTITGKVTPVYTFAYEDEALDLSYFENMMAIADADNNGRNELVVSTRGDNFSENVTSKHLGHVFMYTIEPGGAIHTDLIVDLNETYAESSWIEVGDADNDGKNEIVIATGKGDRKSPGKSFLILVKKKQK